MTGTSIPSSSAPDEAPALKTPDHVVSFGELRERVGVRASALGATEGAAFLVMRNDVTSVVDYLALVEAGIPVALVDPAAPDGQLASLVGRYRPALVMGADGPFDGYRRHGTDLVAEAAPTPVNPRLAVMLSTSGSTGSPKFVRLSGDAILANAASIAEGLEIAPGDCGAANLPLHYSYGLSVLNSHLRAGASVALTDASVVQREFWELVDRIGCTSLAGVPYSYQMLRRLRFDPAEHPSVRTMTQAGGKLADALVAEFHGLATRSGTRFFVMYGQTEATARMAILHHDDVAAHPGSAGRAIAGGRFEVVGGELWYEGPNVMLGYAVDADDLAADDELGGRLATGDLGTVDADGFVYITGRAKRIGKVFGARVSLDEIEEIAIGLAPVAAVAGDDHLTVYVETADQATVDAVKAAILERTRLPRLGVKLVAVDDLPRRSNGKMDYAALETR